MRFPVFAIALCGLAVATAATRQGEMVVPVHQEPRHRLVFDSPGTKILDVQIPSGDTTIFHTHSDPILYVTMSSSQTRTQTLGGEWSGGRAPASVPAPPPARLHPVSSVTSYAKQPLTHRVNNIGSTLFRLIGITNASAGDASTAPAGDFTVAAELDNQWFRAYRYVLAGDAALEHRHANPIALVVVEGEVTVPGTPLVALPPRGAFVFLDAGKAHTIRAVGGSAEVVEVEIRRPR